MILFLGWTLAGLLAAAVVGAAFGTGSDAGLVAGLLTQVVVFAVGGRMGQGAWRAGAPRVVAGAAVGGVAAGVLGGAAHTWAVTVWPALDGGVLAPVERALGGPLAAVLGVTVVLGAPLGEELMFRHRLWNALGRWAPVGTAVAFLGYHLDPGMMIGLVPLTVWLTWVRRRAGVLGPAIAAHAANNLAAVGDMAWGLPSGPVVWGVAIAVGAAAAGVVRQSARSAGVST